MMHLHRWSKWVPQYRYTDTSFGDSIPSTMVVRTCRCGLAKSRGLYGVELPIPPGSPESQR